MARHQLTTAALARLRAELDDLSTRGRIEIAQRIDEARALGDLKENGDYHSAKEEQGLMEGRIREIESLLANAEELSGVAGDTVSVGTIVTLLYDGDAEDAAERFLVGHLEEIPPADDITVVSPTSPLGSALLGASPGQTVSYAAPNGNLTVKLLGVSPLQ